MAQAAEVYFSLMLRVCDVLSLLWTFHPSELGTSGPGEGSRTLAKACHITVPNFREDEGDILCAGGENQEPGAALNAVSTTVTVSPVLPSAV